MPIKPLNHYSLTNPASIYDEEALTALELAGRTAAKVNENVEAFNKLETETNKHLTEQDAAIPKKIEASVKEHIESGDFDAQIDESLNHLNERVDNLIAHMNPNGTIDSAELTDIRVRYDGSVEVNAGTVTRKLDKAISEYAPIVSKNLFNPKAIKKSRMVGDTIDGDTEWETRDISEPIEVEECTDITVYMNCKIETIVFYGKDGARIGGYMFTQFSPSIESGVQKGYMINYPAGKTIKYMIVQWRNENAPDSEYYNDEKNIMVSLSPIDSFLPFAYDKPAYKGNAILTVGDLPDITEEETSLFMGKNAGANNVESEDNDDGHYNTAIGVRAFAENVTGDHNTAFGFQSMMKNTVGDNNTAFGEDTLFENVDGEHNTAVGIRAMQNNTHGTRNTVVGGGSAINITEGNNNTVVGQNAGNTITTEDANTLIGQWADVEPGVENAIAIGKSAKATKSNQTVIGTENTDEVIIYGLASGLGTDEKKVMSQAAINAEFAKIKRFNVINIKDYGAIGDGVTDDTDAINAALAAAQNGTLFIPTGTFLISGTLHVRTNTEIVGCGAESVIKLAASYSLTAYTWRSETRYTTRKSIILFDSGAAFCHLHDFTLTGQTSKFVDENMDGITVRGNNHIVDNVMIHDINYFPSSFSSRTAPMPGYGILAIDANVVRFENLNVYRCAYEGVGFEDTKTATLANSKIGVCNQTGVQVHRGCCCIFINNNTIDLTGRSYGNAAMTVDAVTAYPSTDIHIDNNHIVGTITNIDTGASCVFIHNNYVQGVVMCAEGKYITRADIRGNHIVNGRIRMFSDYAMIANNVIENNDTGNYLIALYGDKTLVVDNIGIGTGSNDTKVSAHQ